MFKDKITVGGNVTVEVVRFSDSFSSGRTAPRSPIQAANPAKHNMQGSGAVGQKITKASAARKIEAQNG